MRRFRLAMAQINATVGDLEGNAHKVMEMIDEARLQGADLVSFPEMVIPGYPPEDLLFKPQFIRDNLHQLQRIVQHSTDIAVVVGFADSDHGNTHNAAAVISDGILVGVYHKLYLPNYGVFDEARYFQAGCRLPVFVIAGVYVGVNVCEDIWYRGPTEGQRQVGAEVIVNINASPYHHGKVGVRERMLSTRAADNQAFVSYTNMVGGQDELVFDGGSMLFDHRGELMALGRQFEDDLVVADLDIDSVATARRNARRATEESSDFPHELPKPQVTHVSGYTDNSDRPSLEVRNVRRLDSLAEIYGALVIGTRDYVCKNGFEKVVIGLSGGIDSSLTAAIAVDGLDAENVICVSMPSKYTSEMSASDAKVLSHNLGMCLHTIPIDETFNASLEMLSEVFSGTEPDVAEENLQARIRGNILMSMSNKFGWLVLTTGNKSEIATGYTTLYGDMAGGFAVLKDVPKTMVYDLAMYRNSWGSKPVIPDSVLSRPPSAELRHDQRDDDLLPPYHVLDPILKAYVEEDRSCQEIIAMGHDEIAVKQAIQLVDRSEYKRRQSPPGVKITPRAFGRDRRLPIVNNYKDF